jgi:hypothetical protein
MLLTKAKREEEQSEEKQSSADEPAAAEQPLLVSIDIPPPVPVEAAASPLVRRKRRGDLTEPSAPTCGDDEFEKHIQTNHANGLRHHGRPARHNNACAKGIYRAGKRIKAK